MIYDFICKSCGNKFEEITSMAETTVICPKCEGKADRQFHATSGLYIPPYFHTSKSDIFTDLEWRDLKKNPNIERAK